jgi:hypothetical protein
MTSTVAIDTLKLTSHLVRAGMTREHAEAIAAGMNEQMSSNMVPTLATSEQLRATEERLKGYIEALISARIGELEARFTRSMFTMLMAFAALIVTLNKLL